MSVHLPVLLRNDKVWKETPQTSQHREEIVTAQKIEGALFTARKSHQSLTKQQQSAASLLTTPVNNNGSARHQQLSVARPNTTTGSSNNNNSHHRNHHSLPAAPSTPRRRDLEHNPQALKHFFLTHLPSASPSAERVHLDEQTDQHRQQNDVVASHCPSSRNDLTTTTTMTMTNALINHSSSHNVSTKLNSQRQNAHTSVRSAPSTMVMKSFAGARTLQGAATTMASDGGSGRNRATTAHAAPHHEVVFGHTVTPRRRTNNSKSPASDSDSDSSLSAFDHPMNPRFPSNPRQKKETGEGPSIQTSSVRPRIDRAIWPAPASSASPRNHHPWLKNSVPRSSSGAGPAWVSPSQKTQDILAVKNIGAANKILASIQQQQEREDNDEDENTGNDDDFADSRVLQGSKSSAVNKRLPSDLSSSALKQRISSSVALAAGNNNNNNNSSNNKPQQQLQDKSNVSVTGTATSAANHPSASRSSSTSNLLRYQNTSKAQSGLMLQMKHSSSVVGRAAHAERLKQLLKNEVMFEDEEIALRMHQSNLANSSESGVLTDEQEQQLLDLQQKLLYGSAGYIPGVTGPRTIVNNGNRFTLGSNGGGGGGSSGVGGISGGGSTGGGAGGGIATSGPGAATSGAGDLIADPATSPLPFVSIFNGLFPSVSPQAFLYRYIQWVAARRPKSPMHWNSFLPTPEDPHHSRLRHEQAGSLYVGSVSHEKDLFKSFLADVSRSSQTFTDGFVRSVLRCLVDYEPLFFDKVVRTVADHCRREQQQNPQPRSILFQTKALMREAEIQLRERQRKEDMQASTLKSRTLSSMYQTPPNITNAPPSLSAANSGSSTVLSPPTVSIINDNNNNNNNFNGTNPNRLPPPPRRRSTSPSQNQNQGQLLSASSAVSKRNSPYQSNLSSAALSASSSSSPPNANNASAARKNSSGSRLGGEMLSSSSPHQSAVGRSPTSAAPPPSSPVFSTTSGSGGVGVSSNNNFNNNSANHHNHHLHHHPLGGVGGSGTLFSVREVFRAFVDASFTPISLRNVMVVCEFFDPHRIGSVPHYALTQKNFLLRYFEQVVAKPTLSQRANWENLLNAFEQVRQETEDFVVALVEEEKREEADRQRKRQELIRQKQQARRQQIVQKYSDNLQQQQLQLHLLEQEFGNNEEHKGSSSSNNNNDNYNDIGCSTAPATNLNRQSSQPFTRQAMSGAASSGSGSGGAAGGADGGGEAQHYHGAFLAQQKLLDGDSSGDAASSVVVAFPASQLPPFAWFLAAFVGPRVVPNANTHHGKISTPLGLLKALFAKHYDTLPPPVAVPISDFRHLLLCDDRVVTVLQNYTIPECNLTF